jgi:hypothetical protein
MKINNTLAKQTTRHFPSLTGQSKEVGNILFYQHIVPHGTINTTTLSRLVDNILFYQHFVPNGTINTITLSRLVDNILFYQHSVPDGTINTTTLSRQGRNVIYNALFPSRPWACGRIMNRFLIDLLSEIPFLTSSLC